MSDDGLKRDWKLLPSGKRARQRAKQGPLRIGRTLKIESLERRALLSATIPIAINVPIDIKPQDVYLEVSAVLTAEYITKAKHHLPDKSVVYYDAAIDDYALASAHDKFTFALTASGEKVELPNTPVTGGHIAIGIGNPPDVIYTAGGISTPVAATNPRNIFGLFEYAITGAVLDLDVSEIDQVGFPFTITTTPAGPIPAEDGVGISISRSEMFDRYSQYIASQGPTAALFEQSYTYGEPFRLLAPQNVISGPLSKPTVNAPKYHTGGSLEKLTNYYYWVTATNKHGESAPSDMVTAYTKVISYRGISYPLRTVELTWHPFTGEPTGYKFYRSETPDAASARYIGSASIHDKVFKDDGRPLGDAPPPTSGYAYNPLNAYFNNAIDGFFVHYKPKDSFQIERDGYLFKGEVVVHRENDADYLVLDLSPTDGPFKDESFLIYRPYFSNNTNLKGMPKAPEWMPHAEQTPAAMILAADGVFKSTGENPNAYDLVLNDLENSIVSAFNRGIANVYSIKPNNWANEPELNSAKTVAPLHPTTNKLAPKATYYYVITATNADGETTTSLERKATTTADDRNIELAWTAHNSPTHYNVYRSTTPGKDYELVTTVTNDISDPVKGFRDDGTHTPTKKSPPIYYAPGSIANWYSAFFHQNSTNDLLNGVSINGLAYGFPYDDQGSQSTNFQGVFTQVDINIGRWSTK